MRHLETCSLLHALPIPTRDECECLDSLSIIDNTPVLAGGASDTQSIGNFCLDLAWWRKQNCPVWSQSHYWLNGPRLHRAAVWNGEILNYFRWSSLHLTPMPRLRFVLLFQETHYDSLTRNVHICGVNVVVEGYYTYLSNFNCYLFSLHIMCKSNSYWEAMTTNFLSKFIHWIKIKSDSTERI